MALEDIASELFMFSCPATFSLRSTAVSLMKDLIFAGARFDKMIKSWNAQREDENVCGLGLAPHR